MERLQDKSARLSGKGLVLKLARPVLAALCCILALIIGVKNNIFAAAYLDIVTTESYPLVINEVLAVNRGLFQDGNGDYSGYIELYNSSDEPVNLKGFGLSADPKNPYEWRFPEVTIGPKSFVAVYTTGNDQPDELGGIHTSFELKNTDKVVSLTSPHGKWSTHLVLSDMQENIPVGRYPDGSDTITCFDGATAGAPNAIEPLVSTQRLSKVVFSLPSGFYECALVLKLSHPDSEAEIRYTLDGSEPSEKSLVYQNPINISVNEDSAAVIRARAYKKGYPKSRIATQTYFVQPGIASKYDIPVVSIVTDPENLFDYEKGIYVTGKVRDDWLKSHPNEEVSSGTPANFNQEGKRWERPAYVEIFEPGGNLGLSESVGIRTHGGYSLSRENKSLKIVARDDYGGQDFFNYDFYRDGQTARTKGIILRNSATDSKSTFFRDAFIQSLANPERLDLQKFRPCIAYINGEYYGIYNIRTLYNEEYISERYHINLADIVIIKNQSGSIGDEVEVGLKGDEMQLNQLYRFIEQNDMSIDANYQYVQTQIDIDNYIEYNILEIFSGNEDWPANNVRIWRKRTSHNVPDAPYGHDGRWRWLIFDLDFGFGLFGKSPDKDTFKMATEINSTAWNNPPWSTMMLRRLLKNDAFETKFINRFCDLLNSNYKEDNVMRKLDAMQQMYQPYVPEHIKRWNLHKGDIGGWLKEIEIMREYVKLRPAAVRGHIQTYFGLSAPVKLKLKQNEGGTVRLNSLTITSSDWEGLYFREIPITLEAMPEEGYCFAGWKGAAIDSKHPELAIHLASDAEIQAVFKKEVDIES